MTARTNLRFMGEGQMVDLVNDFDWSATPLGAINDWSQSTRVLTQQLLVSDFPMFLWFGPDLISIYNDAYRSIISGKHPEALGRPAAETWSEIWDVILPLVDEVIGNQRSTYSENLKLMMERSGYLEETYFTFSYSPFYDDGGQVNGVFCAVTETTGSIVGRRRLEAMGRLADALIDAATIDRVTQALGSLEGIPDLPSIALYLVAESSQELTNSIGGAKPKTNLDPAVLDALHAHQIRNRRRTVDMAADSIFPTAPGHSQVIASPVVDSGSQVSLGWLAVLANPNRPLDESYLGFVEVLAGLVSGGISTVRVVEAERKRAETLAEIDQAKSAFFSNVSHEFRTPLTLMLGPVEDALADSSEPLGPHQKQRLEMVHRNGIRMTKLVDSLLETTRLSGGKRRPELALVELGALTADLASAFRSAFEAAGIALTIDVETGEAPVLIDPRMWESIVLNLISNSLKYTEAGEVHVSLRTDRDGIVLNVADTGIGIPPAELPKVFDRFHRIEGSGVRGAEGLGIGLALVKELAAELGGAVSAESKEGTGSTFAVRLPLLRREGNAAAIEPSASVAQYVEEALSWPGVVPQADGELDERAPNSHRARILVVDDNVDMNTYLCRLLGEHWEVKGATNATEGRDVARHWLPHVVVSDVMMPGVDGFEFTKQIKSDRQLRSPSVVILSARAGADAAIEGLEIGADDYIVKPFTSDELLRRMRVAVERSLEREKGRAAEQRSQIRDRLGAALGDPRTTAEMAALVHEELRFVLGHVLTVIGVRRSEEGLFALYPGGAIHGETAARYARVAEDAPLPPTFVARTGDPIFQSDSAAVIGQFPALDKDMRANNWEAMATIPLRAEFDQLLGTLSFVYGEARHWSQPDQEELMAIADVLAPILERILRTESEHIFAQDLQRMLLRLNHLPRSAVIAASYHGAQGFVGGDWYDAFAIRDGLIGVVVGDVVGSGLKAAAAMGQLRSAAAAAALVDPRPTKVIEALDHIAARSLDTGYATAVFGVIDVDSSSFEYSIAGNVPPMLVTTDGQVQVLDESRRWPLGLERPRSNKSARAAFPAGSLLVMYTDGLIERRGESLTLGLYRLARKLERIWKLPTSLICERLINDLIDMESHTDDVAVLAVRTAGAFGPIYSEVFPGTAVEVPAARRRLDKWLEQQEVEGLDREFFLLAMNEAMANAAIHGSHDDERNLVTVEACIEPEVILGCVRDQGGWSDDGLRAEESTGLGFELIRALMDDVDVRSASDLTRVVMRLGRHKRR